MKETITQTRYFYHVGLEHEHFKGIPNLFLNVCRSLLTYVEIRGLTRV